MGRYIRPTGIICSENADKIEALFDNKPMQTNFTENDCAVIRRGGYILADFGKELCGGIMLSVQRVSEKRSHCRIVFGESVSEALSTIGEKNSVVILMHDAGDKILTYEMLPNLISYLRDTGYEFKNMYDLIE